MVATVRDGESIPLVQRRITDAGFEDLNSIHMGWTMFLFQV